MGTKIPQQSCRRTGPGQWAETDADPSFCFCDFVRVKAGFYRGCYGELEEERTVGAIGRPKKIYKVSLLDDVAPWISEDNLELVQRGEA